MVKLLPAMLLIFAYAVTGMGAGPEDAFAVRVLRTVDGDTVDVRVLEPPPGVLPRERVRLLGFDAPEVGEPFAAEATRLVRELVRMGDTYLELEEQLRDPYVRLLAHLWVDVDGTWLLVGEEVLRAGLGTTLFIPPNNRHWDRLRGALHEAQLVGAGMWGTHADPLTLRCLETDPVPHVTEVVTVRFHVDNIQALPEGKILHAGGSGMGFHVVVDPEAWVDRAEELRDTVGTRIDVRGVLDWDRLSDGPFIRVAFAEQIEVVEEWPHGAFVHGPYTGAPETQAATVSWTATPALPARVDYGPWSEFDETGELSASVRYTPEQAGDRQTAHVRLDGLEHGTRYAYRVVLKADDIPQGSPIGSFHTAPDPGAAISFAVIADTQWQWEGVNRIQRVGEALAADPQPFQFILHGGDIVESPIPRYWDHTFASLSSALLRAPFLPVLGNHERNSRSYYTLFSLPPGGGLMDKRWWALDFGDVAVVGLDTNVSRPGDYRDQVDFLYEHLSGDHKHRFVIFHHPVFSSDAIYGPGSEGLQALFHPAFVELGVDIVFTGHAHNYERIHRDGVTYLMVGGGGAIVRPLSDERVEGSVVACDEHLFYVAVSTDREGIAVEAVKVARQLNDDIVPAEGVLDAFTLPAD